MKLSEISSRDVQVIEPQEPLIEAARRMLEHQVGALVVVQKRAPHARPIGIVTDRDIVCGQYLRKADIHLLIVSDVMTSEPGALYEDSGLADAIETLRTWGVRRAPVVNDAGELRGIVTLDDLLPAVATELNNLSALIGTQARRH
jgi:CBS domain-containing protein